MRYQKYHHAVLIGLLASVLVLLPGVAAAGSHSGDGDLWFIGGVLVIFGALGAGFLYVLVRNITGISENKPSITAGTIAMVLGGLNMLSIVRIMDLGSGAIRGIAITSLMGGGLFYLGYRNVDMAKKQREQVRLQPPPT